MSNKILINLISITAFSFIWIVLSCGASSTSNESGTKDTDLPPSTIAEIDIHISGIDGGTAILGGIYGDQYYRVTNLEFDTEGNAKFLQNQTLEQGLYFIQLPGDYGTLQILIPEDQEFQLNSNVDDLVENMKITGSIDNTLFYEHLMYQRNYQTEFRTLSNEIKNASGDPNLKSKLEKERKEMIAKRRDHILNYEKQYPGTLFARFLVSGQSPIVKEPKNANGEVDKGRQSYMYRNEYWDNFDFSDGRMLRTPVYHNKLEEYIGKFVPQNTDSLIKYAGWLTRQSQANDSLFKYTANYIGIKYKKPEFMGGDGVYAYMVENFFTNELAFWSTPGEIRTLQYDAALRKKSLPGAQAQNLKAQDSNGNEFELYKLKSKYIVLYFYSVTCENCQKETPKLVNFYKKWKNQGVEVIAFSIDDDKAAWDSYRKKTGMQWISLFDPDFKSGYNSKYHVDITPEMYLLDENKIIIGKDLKTNQIEELILRHEKG